MVRKIGMAIFAALLFASPAVAGPKIKQIGPALAHPWGMDFLSANEVLVSERAGRLVKINLTTGEASQISNIPDDIIAKKQGGLLDVMVDDGFVYLCYSKKIDGGSVTSIDRGVLAGTTLTNRTTIFQANKPSRSGLHFGCRMVMHNGHLFASLGERGARDNAQDPANHAGSVIRILPDGTIPSDNPALGNPANHDGWAAQIYSIGHRNPQGMTVHPDTGDIWTHEHGPRGGDEINIIAAGANYGWPVASYGNEYVTNRPVSDEVTKPGITDPKWIWTPSIAPSGMAFYPDRIGYQDGSGDDLMFPELAGSLLVGSLKFRRLHQIKLDADGLPSSETILFENAIGRIRDVAVAPDGSILLLNDVSHQSNPPGGLYRLAQ